MTNFLTRLVKQSRQDPLVGLIDEYLVGRYDSPNRAPAVTIPVVGEPHKSAGKISPSQVNGCKRKAVLAFLGVKRHTVRLPEEEALFDAGTWSHHKWQAQFVDMQYVLGTDRLQVLGIESAATHKPLLIRGRLDIELLLLGDRCVVDIKTTGRSNYVYRLEEGPSHDNVCQLTCYLVARDVEKGYLLYENRDDGAIKPFVVYRDDKTWTEVREWCQDVLRHIDQQKLPRKHDGCTLGSTMQRRCAFRKYCYGTMSDDTFEKRTYAGWRSGMSLSDWWRYGLEQEQARDGSPAEGQGVAPDLGHPRTETVGSIRERALRFRSAGLP